ncbi:MAG: 3'-5' exonuclease, partial [Planctomycetota bacterium]
EPILERAYENAPMRLRDIEQLELIATGYRSRSQFITTLTLDPPDSTADLTAAALKEQDYLTLSTIHSAKGREWDVVHIIRAIDGAIPSDRALGEKDGLEEERRVFYVALTRAKDWLYVYFPVRHYRHHSGVSDEHGYARLTRFLPPSATAFFEERIAHAAYEDELTACDARAGKFDDRVRALWHD